jgi:uracil-DNA glycosylase family 4
MKYLKLLSPYRKHVLKWDSCQRCPLCKTRKRTVLARGRVPCDVLFVGEAPGASENVLGQPFKGPAGHILDYLIEQTLSDYSYCLTNLIACIPIGEGGDKIEEPSEESIKACQPRLQEMVRLCKPRLIVTVGKLSDKWTPIATERLSVAKGTKPPQWCSIIHPAAITRMEPAQQGLAVQRCTVALEDAVADL